MSEKIEKKLHVLSYIGNGAFIIFNHIYDNNDKFYNETTIELVFCNIVLLESKRKRIIIDR